MAYLPDLSVYALVDGSFDPTDGVGESRLRAVGWLDPQYSYPHSTDPPSDMLLDSLVRLRSAGTWKPLLGFYLFGYHRCLFCPDAPEKEPTIVTHKGWRLEVGAGGMYVPGRHEVYVAPTLILHYILAHGYRPPPEFCSAAIRSPMPGSRDYDRHMKRHGPAFFRWNPHDDDAPRWRQTVGRHMHRPWFRQTALGRRLVRAVARL